MFNKLQNTVRPSLSAVFALAVGLLMCGTGTAHAVPQIMNAYGDQMAWSGAEINAMGGTGVAVYRGGLSNILNPAMLSAEQGFRVEGGLMLDQEHEDRFQPLFDSFDSWVADAAIASNRNHYWQTGFGAAIRDSAAGQPLVWALSLTDRYPFGYTFTEELRNPSPFPPGQGEPARDILIEERRREINGTLRNLSLGVGTTVSGRISLGAAVHYAFGTREAVDAVRDYITTDGDDSYRIVDSFDMSGVNFTLGAQGVISERISVGVAWESRLTVDGDWSTTSADTVGSAENVHEGFYRYPSMIRGGFVFRPRTNPLTVFTIEAEYKPWSEMEDNEHPDTGNPLLLNDVTEVRVGLEHLFYNGIPLRFGFRHFDSYADRDAGASVFSCGVGAPIGTGMLAASLELSKLSSVQEHQFPYPRDFFGDNFENDDFARVEDTRFRIGVSYKMEF